MKKLLIVAYCLFNLSLSGQNTVGLLQYDEGSFEGYTLFSPINTGTTYLVDNCGSIINLWQSNFKPGLIAYLREDGSLIRTGRIQTTFNAGGSGGRLEIFSWEGNLKWANNFTDLQIQTHHDIALLPNGNILLLLWEKHSYDDAIAKGKNPDLVSVEDGMWSEKIWEIKTLPDDQFEIVWEWNSWDHIVQDINQEAEGFGIVSEHPEKFNINYPPLSQSPDWMHMNSIDYNEELDQILLSSRNFNEIFIIDHSTTTEEAKTGTGGKYGKGGDILYRWGNPSTYNLGTTDDQKLYGQHDAHWIDYGLPGEGNILIFNNGFGRPGVILASTLEEITPDLDGDGFYELNENNIFGPQETVWTYPDSLTNDFYEGRISGSQRLGNGNTLVCLGRSGKFLELTETEDVVWQYQSPVSLEGPIPQGANAQGTEVFKIQKYGYDYQAFEGRNTSPSGPVEINPNPDICHTTSINSLEDSNRISIYPNPFTEVLNVQVSSNMELDLEIYNQLGRTVFSCPIKNKLTLENLNLKPGLYFIQISDSRSKYLKVSTLIKL